MTDPGGPRTIRVGVLLARAPEDLGGWLADGAAFDAAGADALWVDVAPEPDLDPLVLTAALAAVTVRSLLVTAVLPGPSEDLARVLATIGRLSRGRLRILADTTLPRSLDDIGVFRRVPGNPEAFEPEAFEHEAERWVATRVPNGRATWRETLVEAGEQGTRGLVVPADPRLLDLLRNPDDPGQRRDLQLAQG